jgi:hypothetical protein
LTEPDGAQYSLAHGFHNLVFSFYGHAEGFNTSASYAAHSEGRNTKALPRFSHAEGVGTKVGDHSEGTSSVSLITNAYYGHAEGYNSMVLGRAAHSEGYYNTSSGWYSHAEGGNNKTGIWGSGSIYGQWSHAEGYGTQTLGPFSHTEGYFTKTNGSGSHAEGAVTIATGNYSHAEGRYTSASANYSHVEGYGTESSGSYQHVSGKFNIPTSTLGAFIIGNGLNANNKSNLLNAHDSVVEITGSIHISSIINIAPGTLPSVTNGGLAVSSSGDLYFGSGSSWHKVSLS